MLRPDSLSAATDQTDGYQPTNDNISFAHHHYVPSVVNRSAVMDSIHDSLRYVHGGGPIPSTVTGHKSGSVKTVPVMCHTSYCHGF